ncbi:hypothetical protein JOQ06_028151 [Pogonophryne albipinna]|uniref:Uncharacterized protein n=1 Tax=Pogonophryne albipinna TaxID=1090488 RepID=A0AAD6AFS6_9TELE|nr:hypothetical protein JOQ06_028151 [Pogonophryne albipinna]
MILLTPSSGFFQCTNKIFLTDEATGQQIKEFARKNAANALSIANMVMGMTSILSSLHGHHHAACWLVLIGYLLDLADGAQINVQPEISWCYGTKPRGGLLLLFISNEHSKTPKFIKRIYR